MQPATKNACSFLFVLNPGGEHHGHRTERKGSPLLPATGGRSCNTGLSVEFDGTSGNGVGK